jgi:hypothetical protein
MLSPEQQEARMESDRRLGKIAILAGIIANCFVIMACMKFLQTR